MKYSGNKLRMIVQSQGRRVAWLAEQVDLHFTTVYRMMDGSRSISDEQAQRFADVLGIGIEQLQEETEVAA